MNMQAIEQRGESLPLVRLAVLECKVVGQLTLAVVQVLDGELTTAMHLADDDTGEHWEVRGFAFAPLAAVEQGRLGVLLDPVGHEGQLRVGIRLHQLLPAAASVK